MSYRSRSRSVLHECSEQVAAVIYRLGRLVFRDYGGVFVFLFSCSAAMVFWRTTFSITDNLTIANGLVALSDGHLHVATPTYSETLRTPGMAAFDGRMYPRNIAHLVFALPILWVLDSISAVADIRIALAGLWSLSVFGTVSVGGRLVNRQHVSHLVGGVLALITFVTCVTVATPFPHDHLAYSALQLVTILAAAGCALVAYRLLSDSYSFDVGLAAGIAVGIASPALLWATIPKRHVLVALFLLLTLFFLYRSRESNHISIYRRYRAIAYLPVGLTAWVHASEALVLLVALVVTDFITARENGIRTLVTVVTLFFFSLLPFFLTNYLISGDPFTPPRLLDRHGGDAVGTPVTEGMAAASDGSGSGGGTASTAENHSTTTSSSEANGEPATANTDNSSEANGESATANTDDSSEANAESATSNTNGSVGSNDKPATTSTAGDSLDNIVTEVTEPLTSIIDRAFLFLQFLSYGIEAIRQNPDRLYHTFIRSGYIEFSSRGATGLAINTAFLEVLPIAGALAAIPIIAFRKVFDMLSGTMSRDLRIRPIFAADIFVLIYATLITLLYIYRLPIHASLTVRYVYPLFPLAIYGVARLQWVRVTVADRSLWLGFTYAGSVLIGGQLVLLIAVVGEYTPDEMIQGLALLSLTVMVGTGLWSITAALDHPTPSLGAILLGIGSGLTTILMATYAFAFFGPSADFVLPLVPI